APVDPGRAPPVSNPAKRRGCQQATLTADTATRVTITTLLSPGSVRHSRANRLNHSNAYLKYLDNHDLLDRRCGTHPFVSAAFVAAVARGADGWTRREWRATLEIEGPLIRRSRHDRHRGRQPGRLCPGGGAAAARARRRVPADRALQDDGP